MSVVATITTTTAAPSAAATLTSAPSVTGTKVSQSVSYSFIQSASQSVISGSPILNLPNPNPTQFILSHPTEKCGLCHGSHQRSDHLHRRPARGLVHGNDGLNHRLLVGSATPTHCLFLTQLISLLPPRLTVVTGEPTGVILTT